MTALAAAPIAASGELHVGYRSASRSHVGRVRAINEDRVFDNAAAGLWVVADGMGGHAGGDLAAQAVIDRMRELVTMPRPLTFIDVLVALGQANADIRRRNDAMHVDAGATVVALFLDAAGAHIAWAGDSRAYRLRDGRLELLTRDHSVVQELVDAGLIAADDAERHPQANLVTRALGASEEPRLQTMTAAVQPGDRLLLCSDGLSRSLRHDDEWVAPIDRIADEMIQTALDRDGSDNISLVIVEQADSSLCSPTTE